MNKRILKGAGGDDGGSRGGNRAGAAPVTGSSGRGDTWFLRCICDETRFAMLDALRDEGELCVGDFASRLEKDQPLVSHHLRQLRECGILVSRQDGKKTMYRISSTLLAGLIADIADAGKKIPHLCSSEPAGGDGRACGC